jgi:hypothetical protein
MRARLLTPEGMKKAKESGISDLAWQFAQEIAALIGEPRDGDSITISNALAGKLYRAAEAARILTGESASNTPDAFCKMCWRAAENPEAETPWCGECYIG